MFGSPHSVFRAEIKYYRLACGAVKLMIIIYAYIKSTEKNLDAAICTQEIGFVFNQILSLYELKCILLEGSECSSADTYPTNLQRLMFADCASAAELESCLPLGLVLHNI